jgi:hypothetical protein
MSSNAPHGRISKSPYGEFAIVCAFATLGLLTTGAAILFGFTAVFD